MEVEAGETLSLTFNAFDNDGVLYLLEDCSDLSTCLAAADDEGLGDAESLTWENEAEETVLVYGLVDTREGSGAGSWTLQVTRTPPTAPVEPIGDTCVEADDLGPFEPGTYGLDFDDHTDDFSPPTGCTGFGASGRDGAALVELDPGEILTVIWHAPPCDVSLYLLEDCATQSGCLDGSDVGGQTAEVVSWQNHSPEVRGVYVIADIWMDGCHPTATDPGVLVIEIEPPDPVGAPTCADAEVLDPLTDGFFGFLDISGGESHLDLGETTVGACDVGSSTGPEWIVPIEVEAGRVMTASFDPTDGEALLYVVEDCDDVDTCLVAADGGDPEVVSWHNADTESAEVFLVLDAPDAGSAADSGLLSLETHWPHLPTADVCGDAQTLDPLAPGTWIIDLSEATDTMDPTEDECPEVHPQPGADVFVPLVVQPGERWTLRYEGLVGGSDVGMYILDACDAEECDDGADENQFSAEEIVYPNHSAQVLHKVLVLDSGDDPGPTEGRLEVTLE